MLPPPFLENKLTVGIVAPFAGKDDGRPVSRTHVTWLRNRLSRLYDQFLWRMFGRWRFHFSTYEDRVNTNRGDMAIRIATRALLAEAIGDVAEFIEIGWDDLDEGFLARSSGDVDLVVLAGGGYLFCDSEGKLAPRVGRHLDTLMQLPCPVVGFCLGMNRLVGTSDVRQSDIAPTSQPLIKRFFQRLALSSVRDHWAKHALRQVGEDTIAVLPDPALYLNAIVPENLPQPGAHDELWIGVNLAFHGKETTPILAQQLPVIVDVLRQLRARKECRFFYFVHYDTERLIPRLLAQAGISVTVVDCRPEEMVAWYRLLHVHICSMLHSSILAFNAHIPTINFAYDIKNYAFYEMMGMSDWILPATPLQAEEILCRLEALIANRKELSARIAQRKDMLRLDLDRFLELIAGLAHARPESGRSVEDRVAQL